MPNEKEREARRVVFERPLTAQMMAIDGTWRRPCLVKDVSENSATLKVETSIEGLALTEFFLVLSSTGLAYRRCQLDRVNGDELEVSFLHQKAKKKQARGTPT
ncbi:PilZ domain-containing protein [Bradyrhizobium betae]|uniref:Pilus assembly protein PilZ n=1 Tax=Bradyrhizobium betae TaxID=244734 RepID=A0A4Q1V6E5_9BRAD|nr:PilZ domain-containing protein [Bradyrhizobium betae]RXT46613.1 pilus assembly protein PilZ [Bradyrhizobium betae]